MQNEYAKLDTLPTYNHEETLRAPRSLAAVFGNEDYQLNALGTYGLATRNDAELKEAGSIAKEPYLGFLEDFSQKVGC